MRIEIITGFPKLIEGPLNESIIRQAQKKRLIDIIVHDLRDYTHDRHKTIDDTPYGGGPGMILKPEPFFECLDKIRTARDIDEVILMSPEGSQLTQSLANQLSLLESLVILCGHYKGVDDRVRQGLATREISIGDYVLSGGELPALVLVDAVVRLIPGVLGDGESALKDSFQSGQLDHPHYTRPPEYRGMKVPEVLLSGNHSEIEAWREEKIRERTEERRKDLIR
ncbi:MAG: tRNA (guanosine(37)-N1)-methyltransferase TrmD [Bacteroidota bacterium]